MSDNHEFVVKLDFKDRISFIFVESYDIGDMILKDVRAALKSENGSYRYRDTVYSLEGFRTAHVIKKGTELSDAAWIG